MRMRRLEFHRTRRRAFLGTLGLGMRKVVLPEAGRLGLRLKCAHMVLATTRGDVTSIPTSVPETRGSQRETPRQYDRTGQARLAWLSG